MISQVYVGTCHICEYHSFGMTSYRHLCELIVVGTVNKKHVRADPRVKAEYQSLRDTSHLKCILKKNVIPVVLLNIWSLESHTVDFKFDNNLMNCPLTFYRNTAFTISLSI